MFVCRHLVRFFEYSVQSLSTPRNKSASWNIEMGFNWAFKELRFLFLGIRKHKYYCHNRSDFKQLNV